MNDPKTVGEIIKKYRLKKGLTQKGLALLLFVEETTISRWECGLGYPNTYLIDDICKVLSIESGELLGTNNQQVVSQPIEEESFTKYKNDNANNIWLSSLIFSLSIILTSLVIILFSLASHLSWTPLFLSLFVASLITCVVTAVVSLLNAILSVKKKKQLLWANISTNILFLLLECLFILIAFLFNQNSFYILSTFCSLISVFSLTNYLINTKCSNKIIKTINYILSGLFSFLVFGTAFLAITIYSYVSSSTVVYCVALYFLIVVSNVLAYIFVSLISKLKRIFMLSVPIFLTLNIIYVFAVVCVVLGVGWPLFVLNIFVYLGIANTPFIVLLTPICIDLKE